MPAPRETKRPAANSARLRQLVNLALNDDSTYLDDGAFGESERPSSARHAFDLRRLLAVADPSEGDAGFMLAALREPGVDPDRAVVLISECIAVQHLREPFWSQCLQRLISDPEPRVRILSLRADAYARESAIEDEASEVRIAALDYDGWRRHPIVRKALRDGDARVRKRALGHVLSLPEWRQECERLSTDPDDGVRAEAQKQLAAGISASRAP